MAKILIGCSGFKYAHWQKGVFYPQNLKTKDEFAYYASRFSSVEINGTFYFLPKEKTWQNWHDRAPEDFIYALKTSRFLTHNLKLSHPKRAWQKFWSGARILKNHLGPILFQLPPKFSRDLSRLVGLFQILPQTCRFAFEFRDSSWFHENTYQLLEENNAALVISSHPRLPLVNRVTADFVYLRWHGLNRLYASNYSNQELLGWALKIKGWFNQGLDVYGYFNNDSQGFAPKNAAALIKILRNPPLD